MCARVCVKECLIPGWSLPLLQGTPFREWLGGLFVLQVLCEGGTWKTWKGDLEQTSLRYRLARGLVRGVVRLN